MANEEERTGKRGGNKRPMEKKKENKGESWSAVDVSRSIMTRRNSISPRIHPFFASKIGVLPSRLTNIICRKNFSARSRRIQLTISMRPPRRLSPMEPETTSNFTKNPPQNPMHICGLPREGINCGFRRFFVLKGYRLLIKVRCECDLF